MGPVNDVASPIKRDQSWKNTMKPFGMSDTSMGRIFRCHIKNIFVGKYDAS
jgi:hypothetical protein